MRQLTDDPLLDPARLAAVSELALESADQQPVFAHLNDLAQLLLGAPVSVVSLVTDRRHVSVGQAGLNDDRQSHLELPLTHALCTEVARSGEALIIEDAQSDAMLVDHLGVRDFGIGAYAGAPLRLQGGEVVGAFCAIDSQPRPWTPEQLSILAKLTTVASTLLDQRRDLLAAELRDGVTGLPRLPLFHEHLRTLLGAAEPHERVAVVAVDLDDFSLLNDAWGHAAGDAVLADVGLRLEQLMHRRRAPGYVCRLAADTFLLAGIVGRSEPRDRLQHDVLSAVTRQPAHVDGRSEAISARAATILPDLHADPVQVTGAAKAAVRAKDGVDPREVSAVKHRRLMIRNRLWTAKSRDELELHFQPIYGLADGAITGFEALLRWTSADLGPVSPNEFIPEAERSGAIVPIGEWVIEQGLRDLARWRAVAPERELTLSVNVAPEQLLVPAFADAVCATLAAIGLPGSALIVEVTERTLGEHRPAMIESLVALRAADVRVSIDDFGTGWSSLSRLAQLPIDELKIDRSFVARLGEDPRTDSLVGGIVAMADNLGLTTVAEGVETADQHRHLQALGCTHAQGFLLARPAPAAVIATSIRER